MNKTVKTILQIAGYIISALLGAYGGSANLRGQTRTKDSAAEKEVRRSLLSSAAKNSVLWKTHTLKSLSMPVRCCSL